MGNFQPGSPGFWLIVMVILLVVEAMAPGLVCIWFALGALAALFSALGGMLLPGQIVLFLLVSIAALFVTRPLVKKYINSKTQHTNADRILGQECVVTEQIDNLAGTGEIAVDGKRWSGFEVGQMSRSMSLRSVPVSSSSLFTA